MTNETDKEQIEHLKKWFKEYGLSIILAVIIGLGVGAGWRWYKAHQVQQKKEVSMQLNKLYIQYETLSLGSEKEKAAQLKTFVADAKSFRDKHSGTMFADLTNMLLLKESVNTKDYDSALMYAKNIYDSKQALPSIRQIAVIRAVRIFHQENKDKQAKALLDIKIDTDGAFDNQIARVRKMISS
jgi:predicted negative regulator of RcsB-dependent stress response